MAKPTKPSARTASYFKKRPPKGKRPQRAKKVGRALQPRLTPEAEWIVETAAEIPALEEQDPRRQLSTMQASNDSLTPNGNSDMDTPELAETEGRAAPKPRMKDIVWQEGTPPVPGRKGPDVIKDFVTRLPNAPGVYRMIDGEGEVMYVGKAKSLKKRVANYSAGRGHGGNRTARMIAATVTMEFVTTRTETEALLLEANLIKRLRPRFNVLMRDDKSFPYIFLTDEHEAPGLFKHRGARNRKGSYFGPFASAGAVTRTVNAMQRAFMLRTCTDSVYDSRTRPCLLYQIKRCAGPCTGEISKDDYAELVANSKDFLSGRSRKITDSLSKNMRDAAEDMDFERAAIYRDRLSALAHVSGTQGINPQGIEEADVFAVHQAGGQTCIQVFFFRTGQNWGNRAYFPRHEKSIEATEVLGAFVAQFYDDKPVPRVVMLSDEIAEAELLAEALSEKADRKVQINVPQRGPKRDVVAHVLQNAREALGRRMAETSSQTKLLEGVAEAFGLDEVPKRIEVYDNSHIMGTNAVGGMVVAGPGGFMKNHYRKFNIKSEDLVPGDDFGMMQEVMTRRFSRLVKEHGNKHEQKRDEDGVGPWPDLILIDGGLGQLNAVRKILSDLGIEDQVAMVGIAKGPDRDAGRETFFMPGREAFKLPMRDPVLYFTQRLRDEAHRFAIGTHRARRKKELVSNPLDEIAGIGPTRKKALLNNFGSAKAVGRASEADLRQVEGISAQMAQQIYAHFHEN
ncbi:MAG: excinuclease ABC subunit UvrC [Pseudomonadota bacterium]